MDETWMIFILEEAGLRTHDLSGPRTHDLLGRRTHDLFALAEGEGLRTKKTCFGALVEGDGKDTRRFVDSLRKAYGGAIYAKRRAFSIEDTEVCASTFRFEAGLPPWLPRYTGQIRRYTS